MVARVLILRSVADAATTVARLRDKGHVALTLPMHEIVHEAAPAPGLDVAGFVVTSANAVPPLAAAFPDDGRPVLAVGERTAAVLGAAGFQDVVVGEGDGQSLALHARKIAASVSKPLLYAAGRVRTDGLEAALEQGGVPFLTWEVYDTRPLPADAARLKAALGGSRPDAVLLLSTGQARAFGGLVGEAGSLLSPPPRLLCLSARIAGALPAELRPQAEISDQPCLDALFDLIG